MSMDLGGVFLLTGREPTLVLGKQIPQTQIFQFSDVRVHGFVQVLHVDGYDIDVIDYLISIGGHYAQPWKERLSLIHVLPGAHLVAVVRDISVRVSHLDLKDILDQSQPDPPTDPFGDINWARDGWK